MGDKPRIYLDYNATAPIHDAVVNAVADALRSGGNPSSVHGPGRAAKAMMEKARERIAAAVGARPRDVVFTSSGTEANLLAARQARGRPSFVSAVEHDSVRANLPEAVALPVTSDGVLDMGRTETILAGHDRPFVALMLANNETGVVQPVPEVAEAVRARGGHLHVDAIQALGKMTFDIGALGADSLSISAHKVGGPPGVGALVLRRGVDLTAVQRGGGQELGRRAGTENVPGIAGFAAAVEAMTELAGWQERAARLRDSMEERLAGAVFPGKGAVRLPNTSAIRMPGVAAATQLMALDMDGFAVSAGAACSSGKVAVSHVLLAMGLDDAAAGETLRVSLGWGTSEADVDAFVAAWTGLRERLGRRAA